MKQACLLKTIKQAHQIDIFIWKQLNLIKTCEFSIHELSLTCTKTVDK